MPQLELWGGHECTLNRVGDGFVDQTRRSGHHDRPEDLDLFFELGLRTLRYPVLWERVAPEAPDRLDWTWSDARLGRLQELGVKPIVGLLHHGSGPAYTDLTDPEFAPAFARFARAAAERYPWVEDWTPINEPLTTARFSTLYGHWHPHAADETAFWCAVLNQIDGVQRAMSEIRAVNPQARLIQTEDLGRTYSTGPLAHQAAFDNARRWMTWDLLCGRVVKGHPLWARLEQRGFGDHLRALADRACPPDVLGVNHYLTSDRFLDHRIAAYPPDRQGGNAFMTFADVEAVRVTLPAPAGLEGVLQEAWDRYRLPLAVTESHNGCTREEQVRWLREGWDAALLLRARGVDVRAVTAWALLGAYDWNSLLTQDVGHYEVGAFDVRGPRPRPTALAAEIRRLTTPSPPHPATLGGGWWRRDIRLAFRPVFRTPETPEPRAAWNPPTSPTRALIITGATGTLGRALARACEWRGIAYRLTNRHDLNLDDADSIARCLDQTDPWGVINAAGWVRVDDAERDVTACMAANAGGASRLAEACATRDLPFAGFSSDLVFDGHATKPYLESDTTAPCNVYGVSKAEAERRILASGDRALMVRTAAFFSPYDTYNFAAHVRRQLCAGLPFEAAEDLMISPTYVPDLADAVLDLLIDGETGLRHLANDGVVTWAELARRLASALGLDADLIRGVPAAKFGWAAARPAYAALGAERGQMLPSLENAIARYAGVLRDPEFSSEAEAAQDRARREMLLPG